MRKILSVLFLFCRLSAGAQLLESFTDGELGQDPAWQGQVSYFRVNSAGQLQSQGPATTPGVVQAAVPCRAATGTSWEFYAQLQLATSGANYADVFLLSDSAQLQGGNSGYFIRIGGTPDEVSLLRKDGRSTPTYVINGRDGSVGKTADNRVRVKVSRDLASRWTLWTDLTGSGSQYEEEGSATDTTYQRSAFMGLLLRYSAANSERFIFDDFRVSDQQAPRLSRMRPTGPRQLEVQFNEAVVFPPGPVISWFQPAPGTGPLLAARADEQDPARVHLTFGSDFSAGTGQLTIRQVEDLFGNQARDLTGQFTYTPPVVALYREVRINELLVDAEPAVDLPQAEFIELYNSSAKTFDLKNWRYADAAGTAALLPAYQLLPGAYVILCRATDAGLLEAYGPVIGLATFPSLNDGGDVVALFDARNTLIDRIAYTTAWYQDAAKTNGGWTLELVNPGAACGNAENFRGAVAPAGGTPGRQNSVYDASPDSQPPVLLQAEVPGARQVRLVFSEALDSLAARNPAAYVFSPALAVAGVSLRGPAYREVLLQLGESLVPRQQYALQVQQVRDCAGNAFSAPAVSLVLPEAAAPGEVVLNEVLFNPRPGGVDFVELLNRSAKYIDLANWQLVSINPDSSTDAHVLTRQPFLLAPQQYLVLTTRADLIRQHYIHSGPAAFLEMSQLPAFPDEAGTVVLLNPATLAIDRFAYHEDMHFALLDDRNGVSLERIRQEGDSSRSNWHSAASTVGFATPGYRNSQHYEASSGGGIFTVTPKAFTPDGDGDRDFATINYQPQANGFLASITIFDAEGREIRRLVKNQLLATKGFFQWDGLNEDGRKAAIGYYVLFIEMFQPGGTVKVYKETVAVGARF